MKRLIVIFVLLAYPLLARDWIKTTPWDTEQGSITRYDKLDHAIFGLIVDNLCVWAWGNNYKSFGISTAVSVMVETVDIFLLYDSRFAVWVEDKVGINPGGEGHFDMSDIGAEMLAKFFNRVFLLPILGEIFGPSRFEFYMTKREDTRMYAVNINF